MPIEPFAEKWPQHPIQLRSIDAKSAHDTCMRSLLRLQHKQLRMEQESPVDWLDDLADGEDMADVRVQLQKTARGLFHEIKDLANHRQQYQQPHAACNPYNITCRQPCIACAM